jgi:hypothetical protein
VREELARHRGLRAREYVGDGPGLDDPAFVEDGDPVAGVAHDLHLVRDHDDGKPHPALKAAQKVEYRAGRLRVEGARRLVAEEDRRLDGERARDGDSLLLPAGKCADRGIASAGKADELEELVHARARLAAADPGDFEGIGDVAARGARSEEVEGLEDHADATALGHEFARAKVVDASVGVPHLARVGPLEKADKSHEG